MSTRNVLLLTLASALVLGLWSQRHSSAAPPAQDGQYRAQLPLALQGVAVGDLPLPVTPVATATAVVPTDTNVPSPTASATVVPPTDTPELPTAPPTEVPTPTEEVHTGRIHGAYTLNGKPLPPGYGADGLPQIELQRCLGSDCEKVARTVSQEGGTFEFVDPPALDPGAYYQVWWVNYPGLAYDAFVYRWWSRKVVEFGNGEDVDLGTMEIGDLKLKAICHDCAQTLPITFKWDARPHAGDVYRWSLFKNCGDYEDRRNAYQTQPLGHAQEYTVNVPPPGFHLDEKYCWFIHIEDGQNGTGSSYYHWRVLFMRQPGDVHVGPGG